MLPLTGITVLALEQAVAAPFATRQLADLGARVIKVERPNVGDFARSFDASVDGMSSYFVWLNRSKESLTLNLQHPEAGYVARDGFTGARRILEGPQGMAAGMSSDADPSKLTEGLGQSWGVLETSFKFHASCRHTHPSADALLQAMLEHNLDAGEIVRVRAHVHQAALDVLGAVTDPRTEHQAKFSMGFVLALIALRGRANVTDFDDTSLHDPDIRAFHDRVDMVLDPEIDGAYPQRWIGLVEVETVKGNVYVSRVDVPKGDPENSLTRIELEQKLGRLAEFRRAASTSEIQGITRRVWDLEHARDVRDLFTALQS